MLLREVEYARPATVEEAISVLATYDGARPLAGGQTLVNVMKARAAAPDVLVDLADLVELRTIGFSSDGMLEIGAMVTCTQLMGSSEVEVARPILAEVASTIADVQVRNRGTIGGNVCVSDPTNHFPVLLVALGATFTIRGQDGERTVPAEEFFLGVYMTAVGEGELLTRIDVPASSGSGDGFAGVTIGAHGTYIVNAAATVAGDLARVAIGCVAASPVRATAMEERLGGLLGGFGARCRCGPRRDARPAVGRPRLRRLPSSPRGGLGRARRAPGSRTEEVVSAPVTSRTVSVDVNGEQIELEVPTRRLLVHFLRDDLGLTGTHIGCDTGNCGACTVHLDGEAVKSCMLLAVQADGTKIATVEGLAADGELTALQQSFNQHHALQCGYCTPGMLMSATALLARNPHPSEEDVRVAIQGNICRCTGYVNIVEAVVAAGGTG